MARVVGRSKIKPRKVRTPYLRIAWRGFIGVIGAAPKIAIPRQMVILALTCGGIYLFGLPHLLVQARSNGHPSSPVYSFCEYEGLSSFTEAGPDCPMIIFRKYW